MRGFGTLRSALQRPAGEVGWAMVCEALGGVSEELFEAELATYVLSALESWPDEVRTLPHGWLQGLLHGEGNGAARIAKRVWLNRQDLHSFDRLCELEVLSEVTCWEFVSSGMTDTQLKNLCDVPSVFGQMRHLDVSYTAVSDEGLEALLSCPWMANLEVLRLDMTQVSTRGVELLCEHPSVGGLRRLTLYSHEMLDIWYGVIASSAMLDESVKREFRRAL